jgi:hypothetical protein
MRQCILPATETKVCSRYLKKKCWEKSPNRQVKETGSGPGKGPADAGEREGSPRVHYMKTCGFLRTEFRSSDRRKYSGSLLWGQGVTPLINIARAAIIESRGGGDRVSTALQKENGKADATRHLGSCTSCTTLWLCLKSRNVTNMTRQKLRTEF